MDSLEWVGLPTGKDPKLKCDAAGRSVAEVVERADLYASELLDPELMSVLRRAVLGGFLQVRKARDALEDLEIGGVERIPHRVLSRPAWSNIQNLSAYDSHCVAVAPAYQMPLLTADLRIGRAPNLPVEVRAVEVP